MDATSQIGREGRNAIIDKIHSALTRIDIDLNRQRAWAKVHANFVYKKNEDIGNMNIEELKAYAKGCHNGWQDLIVHEEDGVWLVCAIPQGWYFNVICNVCVNVGSHTLCYSFRHNLTKCIIGSPFSVNSFVEWKFW